MAIVEHTEVITGIHGVFELLEIETSPKRVIITLLLWIICVLLRQLLELVQDVVCDQIREWCDPLVDDGEFPVLQHWDLCNLPHRS